MDVHFSVFGERNMGHYHTLRLHTEEDILTITLNRPERRNALNPEMISELTHALEAADKSNVGAIILTGAGSAFCAGLDLDHLQTMTAKTREEHRVDSENIARVLRTLHNVEKPTIAAVNGPALAGGMGIATICDFTFAVPEAKFGYTEVKIGFIPAIVSSFLIRQIGDKRTRDLLLTGRLIKADEAHELGLVTRVVDEQDLMSEARKLAQCLLQNSPEAMHATKRLLNSFANHHLDAEIETAVAANAEARVTDDFKEGVRAFLEKRTPDWPSRKVATSAGS
jgi:methylglutaconyl-CoA hydratase